MVPETKSPSGRVSPVSQLLHGFAKLQTRLYDIGERDHRSSVDLQGESAL